MLGGTREGAFGGAERVAGTLVVSQCRDGLSRRASDRLRMRRGPQRRLQLRVLADAWARTLDLLDLVSEQLDAPGELVLVGQQFRGSGNRRPPLPVQRPDPLEHGRVPAEPVEQRELPRRLEEALLVVLPMDLTQPRAERRQGRRPSPPGR